MAKRVKFPLKSKDGYGIRTMEELREYLGAEELLQYYLNGKLGNWLEDRYYEEEAEEVRRLDPMAADLYAKLCQVLGIEGKEDEGKMVRKIFSRQILKQRVKEEGLQKQELAAALQAEIKCTRFYIQLLKETEMKEIIAKAQLQKAGAGYLKGIV